MSRKAVPITLSDHERGALERTLRTTTAAQREVWRARVILLAAEGKENQVIAQEASFGEGRLPALANRPKKRQVV